MKVKIVKQYICEFCNKKGLSAGHMKRHQNHCTLNPHRTCRMCKMLDYVYSEGKLKNLIKILPNPKDYEKEDVCNDFKTNYFSGLEEAVEKVMPELRKESGDCPACILAALRQKGIPVPMVQSFNFTEECKKIWADLNEERENDWDRNYMYG